MRSSGTREISLEGDAQGVLLTASADLATRRSGDGRQPVDNCTEFFDMGVHQVRAANGASSAPTFGPTRPTPAVLEADELTVLTSWAEAIAEVLAYAPERAQAVLADALPGAPWRAALGIAEPSGPLSRAIDAMQSPVRSAIAAADEPTLSGVLLAAVARGPGEQNSTRWPAACCNQRWSNARCD